jgi:hypothetical protein
MVVRDEDMSQAVERHAEGDELRGGAVAAIDDVRHAVDQDQARRILRQLRRADARPALGAEQDEAGALRLALRERGHEGQGEQARRTGHESSASWHAPNDIGLTSR